MPARTLRREESLGLALALVGHAALLAWLVWQRAPAPLPAPERMTVTISDQTGPVSTAPVVQPEEAAPDKAPMLGEAPPPPVPQPQVAPPQPQKPSPIATPLKPPVKPPTKKSGRNTGASVLDPDFLPQDTKGKNDGKGKNQPAEHASDQQRSSWNSAIGGKVAARLRGCGVTGLDVGKLFIDIRFTLAIDGSIDSIEDAPVQGLTPANQAQAKPFKSCATRAIKLAAPFSGLPPEFYNDWKLRKMHLRLQEQ